MTSSGCGSEACREHVTSSISQRLCRPQDPGSARHPATAKSPPVRELRASVGGVGIRQTSASTTEKTDQSTTCHIKRGAKLTALSGPFDSIGQTHRQIVEGRTAELTLQSGSYRYQQKAGFWSVLTCLGVA